MKVLSMGHYVHRLLPNAQVGSLKDEIKVLKEEIQRLKQEVKKRDDTTSSLRIDIEGLKKEIQERDETIQDKVSRPLLIRMPLQWNLEMRTFLGPGQIVQYNIIGVCTFQGFEEFIAIGVNIVSTFRGSTVSNLNRHCSHT